MKKYILAFLFVGLITTSYYAVSKAINPSEEVELCDKKCNKKSCKKGDKKACKKDKKKTAATTNSKKKKSCCSKDKTKSCSKDKKDKK